MSVLKNRAVLRWLVPVTAGVAVIGGGAAVGTFAADADPALPPRTAAQLLVDLQTSRLDGLSGTVVQRADLGLPALANLAGLAGGNELTTLLTGTHTLRVWYSGEERQRIALLDTLGERDLIRDGRDVWSWDSRTNSATHRVLPQDRTAPASLPATPAEAAGQALAAVDPTTAVTVGRSARVAGRDAYELVLTPRDADSLVHQVRIALDAKEHVPLRFEVLADGADKPAFEVAFTQIDFNRPEADQFRFNPPPGVTVKEEPADKALPGGKAAPDGRTGHRPDGTDVRTVGTGWTTVLVARLDAAGPAGGAKAGGAKAGDAAGADQAAGLLAAVPKVSGDWGSGRLLTGKLFSVLLTDDGRVLAGLVTPERLYQAARS
ncbi:sigma-E factor regulatory protein RseB domain-containing protein [Micromonospora sp. 4G57]|uniref:Sigma-E factor regulatory protein RseB domain-containing protein n=1 Tax=Micromonospora sicca TaxID=2202420 RepID=A0ABU5JKC5_9ACTN|nr:MULTISPECIES: sigma-E factor regulatory protein RseB domain-containing protein [unclassified Micromonospora]MDZ5447046.1 sigma-E factor regulatory protein RseB domain-containing protein [Micromonospora sp. 4G57]MDZ5493077.1 sigma-E factor regulatory protein RseB domain-containing protein [Micromonospora sp. 4G53]